MARPRRAVREQAMADTRQRLLDAAVAEFAREGFAGANINCISEAAGFAKGTVYNHFPSKRELMAAVIDAIAAQQTRAIVERLEGEGDPARRLERFFRAGFSFVEGYPAQARVVIGAVYGPDGEFRERVYQAYRPLFEAIARDIAQAGIARGEFRPLDPDLITALVVIIYLGSSSQVEGDGRIWLDPASIVSFILDGLRPRHP